MDSEKREHPRIKTAFELKIQHAETFHWTSLRNLSAGGVFVQTDAPQAVGSTVSMQLALPVDNEPMDIQGRVMWVREASNPSGPGMGIEFTRISEEHRQKIVDFIGDILGALGKKA